MVQSHQNQVTSTAERRNVLNRNFRGARRQADSHWSWLVCICGLVSNTIVIGFTGSFGVLFPAILDEFKAGKGLTALVGSVSVAFTYFCGPVAGKLCERYSSRAVTIFGTILLMSGFIASSQSPNIFVLLLFYSILSAFGTCCIYTSVFVIVPLYFNKRRFLATGLIAAGPGAGVFIITPIVQECLNTMSWRITLLVLIGIIFPISLLACSFDPEVESGSQKTNEDEVDCHCIDSRTMPEDKKPIPLWKNPTWVICTLATAILSFGVPVPSVHMVRYCEELGFSANKASKLYICFGISSLMFRILTGIFLDKIKNSQRLKPQDVFQMAVFVLGLSTALCPCLTTYSWLITYSIIYGVTEGTFSTCINVIILNSVGKKQLGQAYGFWLFGFSVTMALGPAVAGFVADLHGSYAPSFYMAGSAIILSSMSVFLLRCWKPSMRSKSGENIPLREEIIIFDMVTVL